MHVFQRRYILRQSSARSCCFQAYSLYTLAHYCSVHCTKGQIISEGNWGVLNFPKNDDIILRISAIASKTGQIKKK